ncbi:hypothetical protein EV421DRAFT_1745387 [Armillaria borealis]|uniref:Uncharacterized protein n=1 Tax=Armillaria borealis TaxID=47425 RepID=A0AA39IU60_9AGAR|nr:hypothetical protein EV421DRAFT_1745387 [Armillaria borealis]
MPLDILFTVSIPILASLLEGGEGSGRRNVNGRPVIWEIGLRHKSFYLILPFEGKQLTNIGQEVSQALVDGLDAETNVKLGKQRLRAADRRPLTIFTHVYVCWLWSVNISSIGMETKICPKVGGIGLVEKIKPLAFVLLSCSHQKYRLTIGMMISWKRYLSPSCKYRLALERTLPMIIKLRQMTTLRQFDQIEVLGLAPGFYVTDEELCPYVRKGLFHPDNIKTFALSNSIPAPPKSAPELARRNSRPFLSPIRFPSAPLPGPPSALCKALIHARRHLSGQLGAVRDRLVVRGHSGLRAHQSLISMPRETMKIMKMSLASQMETLGIMTDTPEMEIQLVSSHGMLAILEVLEGMCSRDINIKLLQIVNLLVTADLGFPESSCVIGIPGHGGYRGLKVLVDLLDEDCAGAN